MTPYGLLDPQGMNQLPPSWNPGILGVPQFPIRAPRPLTIAHQEERPHFSIWDRIRQGAERMMGIPSADTGLLAPEDRGAAFRQGLIGLGTGIANADPGRGFLHALTQGAPAAREAALTSVQTQDALRARQAGQAHEAARLQFQQKWLGADTTNRQTLQNMLRESVALGLDKESTRIATVLSAMGAEAAPHNIDPNSPAGIAAKVETARQLGQLKVPGYQLKQDVNGEFVWIPEPTSATVVTPTAVRGNVATGVTGQQSGAAAKPELTAAELRAAEQVVEGLKTMKEHYAKDTKAAQTPWKTAAAQGLGHLPFGAGAVASGLVGPAGQSAMSPAQQGFQRGAVQVRHHYVGILPHSRSALGILEDINKGIVPPAGTDSTTIANDFAPQWDFTLSQLEPAITEAKAAEAKKKGQKVPVLKRPPIPPPPSARPVAGPQRKYVP